MEDGYRQESDGTCQEPEWCEGIVMKRGPCCDKGCNDQEEPEISEASMQFFEVLDLLFAGLLALLVLF